MAYNPSWLGEAPWLLESIWYPVLEVQWYNVLVSCLLTMGYKLTRSQKKRKLEPLPIDRLPVSPRYNGPPLYRIPGDSGHTKDVGSQVGKSSLTIPDGSYNNAALFGSDHPPAKTYSL